MQNPVIVIGIGEIGAVLARAYLKSGTPVFPVVRDTDMAVLAEQVTPQSVIVAVGENDLQEILGKIPSAWKDKLVLIQNELLPRDWESHQFSQLTIMSVWFEKKPGQDVKVVVPSVAHGPAASQLQNVLKLLNIPLEVLENEHQLLFELVRKNLYILTTNIAGLKAGGNVSQLWEQNRDLAESVASDVLKLQSQLTGSDLDHESLIAAMVTAFEGDPDHGCMGRSAPARLQRALQLAKEFQLEVPALQQIANEKL